MQASRHLSAELLHAAQQAGIDICIIDPAQPLEEQHGHPFHAILHKVRGDAGAAVLHRTPSANGTHISEASPHIPGRRALVL